MQDTGCGRLEILVPTLASDRAVQLHFQDPTTAPVYDDLMADGSLDNLLDGNLPLPTGLTADLETGAAVLVAQNVFWKKAAFWALVYVTRLGMEQPL